MSMDIWNSGANAPDVRSRIAKAMSDLAFRNGTQPFQNFGNMGMPSPANPLKRANPGMPAPVMASMPAPAAIPQQAPPPLSLAPPPPSAMPAPSPVAAAPQPPRAIPPLQSPRPIPPLQAQPPDPVSNPMSFKDSPAYMGEGSTGYGQAPDLMAMFKRISQPSQPQMASISNGSNRAIY